MKRDMDLIRELLLKFESGQARIETLSDEDARNMGITKLPDLSASDSKHILHNLWLMQDANLIVGEDAREYWITNHITWRGHDFLDSIRDDEIWRLTKDGAKKAGGFTFDILGQLAKGLIKTKIKEHTGVEI
ncbi:MAG: DUF2513 domain-containing protein [Pseudomonadota bacterium]